MKFPPMKPVLLVLTAAMSLARWGLATGWLFSSAAAPANTLVQESILNSRITLSDAEQAEREISPTDVRGGSPSLVQVCQQNEFVCGEEKLDAGRVNDDYCDCEDGSDEPGTAACAGRVLAQFYCNNFGYKSLYISSSKVDDGLCDCCDGSDEPLGACENVCDEVGREYRESMQKQKEERLLGLKHKEGYIQAAKDALENTDSRKAALYTELMKLKQELPPLEESLAKLEEEERKVTEEEQQKLAEDRILSLKLHDLNLRELQRIIVELARRLGEGPVLEEIVRNTFLQREESPAEADLQVEWVEESVHEEANGEEDHLEDKALTGEESRIESTREQVQQLQGQVDSLERDIQQIDEEKDTDYGEANEFWAIKEKCYSVQSDEYKYEFCMYGVAQQDSINLGSWNGFQDNYSVISFTKGTRCWNQCMIMKNSVVKGPERSITIHMECGSEERFHSVQEPSTCEYTGVFTTPAACK